MLVHLAHHNITPTINKQLILELEVEKRRSKLFDGLPGGLGRRQTHLANEDVPNPVT